MSLLVHVHAPHSHAMILDDIEAGRGFVTSDEGVIDFPCRRWGWGRGGDCTISCHPTGLHHNQYVRCGIGLVHLGNGFQRGEERRGEEKERESKRESRTQGMTSMIQVMPSVTVAMKSYLGRFLGNEGEEGVTAEINKCGECDSCKA
jgi:hypothetical protein